MIDNPFSMVVMIVLIVSIAGVMRAKYGQERRRRRGGHESDAPALTDEAVRLRDEVRTLKERVAVLERIATDKSNLLEQEFDRLRDR